MKKLSSSFVTGAIALVFAVLGYQTALLVHYAAVARIVAAADSPDTVFVAVDPSHTAGGSVPGGSALQGSVPGGLKACFEGRKHPYAYCKHPQDPRTEVVGGAHLWEGVSPKGEAPEGQSRRGQNHSAMASRVRTAVAGRRVETFRFNPNTVSVEDLQRLGFSEKQAASIDSYRRKGGHFCRKEDFASSYVVSDSVFRRLEPYIDIPLLDINTADSAAFDALPGIGGYFARRMVEHRRALHGYSYPEQLMDIYHFDEEKFDALKDLITLSPPVAYPLWSLPADSLALHPYIRSVSVARSIVRFRMHNASSSCNVRALENAGILSAENAEKLSKCIIAEP